MKRFCPTLAACALVCALFVGCVGSRGSRGDTRSQGRSRAPTSAPRSYPANDYDIWRAGNLPWLNRQGGAR